MTPGIPWSVLGIEPDARASAEAAARRAGVGVGEWLNEMIRRSSQAPQHSRLRVSAPAKARDAESAPPLRSSYDRLSAELGALNLRDADTGLARAGAALEKAADPGRRAALEDADPIEVVERTIRAIIRHLESSDRRNAAALRQLQSQMHDIAARAEVGPAGDDGEDTRSAIVRIEERLEALAGKVEASLSAGPAPDTALIEERLAALAAKIQELTTSRQDAGTAAADQARAKAAGHGKLPQHGISKRFADLANSLQSSLSDPSPPQELAELHQLVHELSAKVDALSARRSAPAPEVLELGQHIAELARRVGAAEARFGKLESLKPALGDLTERIDAVEQSLHQMATSRDDTSKAFEQQFASLFEQLEASRQAMVDAARFAAAEAAGEAVGEAARQAAHKAIREAQEAAVEAAREAARGYLQTAGGEGIAHTAEEARVVAMLQDSLQRLRSDLDASDRKTETALEAVQSTLNSIAERLISVERQRGEAAIAREAAPSASARDSEMFERPLLSEKLASLRLPPLGRPASEPIEERPSLETPGEPEAVPEETAQGDETDGMAEELNLPRKPGSGPPSSILSDLGTQSHPAEEETAASAGTDATTAEPMAAPAVPGPAADVAPSLRGARTTNELLAAARRAAEAAAKNGKPGRTGRLGLKDRLRIPLSRRTRDGANSDKDAEKNRTPAPGRSKSARTAPGRPAARKPIVLAVAAVILFAGSVEIYNLLKKRAADIQPTPAASSREQPAVIDPQSPESGGSALPEAPQPKQPPSPGATIDGGARDLPGSPQHSELDEPPTGTLVSAGDSAMSESEESPAARGETLLPAELQSAPPAVPPEGGATPADPPAEAADAPELPEKIGSPALQQAAVGGNPIAQFEVASRLAEGRGIKADPAAAAAWYRRAAAGGLAPAQYRLGSLYEKGVGVAKDRAAARLWYERAAAQGNRKAMHNLAVLFADGIGGPPDFEVAARWFRAAAELGLADSQYNLGILYARGLGVPQNFSESYKWFSILANRGDKDAAIRRDAVAGKLDARTLAAAKLAVQTWKAKRLDPEANAVRLPNEGWALQLDKTPAAEPGADIIRNAQKLLVRLGYEPGPVDGRWGPKTKGALESFQRDAGLQPTGALTPDLLRKLQQSSS